MIQKLTKGHVAIGVVLVSSCVVFYLFFVVGIHLTRDEITIPDFPKTEASTTQKLLLHVIQGNIDDPTKDSLVLSAAGRIIREGMSRPVFSLLQTFALSRLDRKVGFAIFDSVNASFMGPYIDSIALEQIVANSLTEIHPDLIKEYGRLLRSLSDYPKDVVVARLDSTVRTLSTTEQSRIGERLISYFFGTAEKPVAAASLKKSIKSILDRKGYDDAWRFAHLLAWAGLSLDQKCSDNLNSMIALERAIGPLYDSLASIENDHFFIKAERSDQMSYLTAEIIQENADHDYTIRLKSGQWAILRTDFSRFQSSGIFTLPVVHLRDTTISGRDTRSGFTEEWPLFGESTKREVDEYLQYRNEQEEESSTLERKFAATKAKLAEHVNRLTDIRLETIQMLSDLPSEPPPLPSRTVEEPATATPESKVTPHSGTIQSTTLNSDTTGETRPKQEPADLLPVDKQPMPIQQVIPEYPDSARIAGLEGTVWVKVLIGEDGSAKKAEVMKSDADVFNESAIRAALQMTFSPAISKGQPIAVWAALPFRFKLNK
jgi:TonB family protein